MASKSIREKCTYAICEHLRPKRKSMLTMEDYGAWSSYTGWSGEIKCDGCGRRVEYVGDMFEKKADVERKLRKLWHVANEKEGSDDR